MKHRRRSPLDDDASASTRHRVNGGGKTNRPGTFQKGNTVASHRRVNRDAIARAFKDAISAEDLAALARRLFDRAMKKGDVYAAREILDRVLGKSLPIDRVAPQIELKTSTAAECAQSHSSIFAQLAAGALTLDQARELSALVIAARDSVVLAELEAQQRELEEHDEVSESG